MEGDDGYEIRRVLYDVLLFVESIWLACNAYNKGFESDDFDRLSNDARDIILW